MRIFLISISFLFLSFYSFSQQKEITFGVGPTTSLFYLNGGPIKNWGTININNISEKRYNIGTSFSLQFNKFKKKNLGYFISLAYDDYGIKFKNTYQRDNFLVEVDTKEKYKTVFLSFGIEKKVTRKKWDLNFGIGLYTFFYFDQIIDLAPYFEPITQRPVIRLEVKDRWGNEAGAQVSLRIQKILNDRIKIGIQPTFFQTLSAFEAEKFSTNIILSYKL
jgi:hypothetical protein